MHKRLSKLLASLGIETLEEQRVGDYSIDCFSEEAWVGFEADGAAFHKPPRLARRDAERDKTIFDTAGIPILRVTDKQLGTKKAREEVSPDLVAFVEEWSESAEERKKKGEWVLG